MKLLRNVLIGAAALTLPVLAAAPAGASTSHPKFINALHAWLPSTKGSNSTEIKEGGYICSDLKRNAIPDVHDPGQPYGTSAILEETATLDDAEVKNGYDIESRPDAIFVLSSDLLGVSVLNLCPTFEPAVRYLYKSGSLGGTAYIPMTNKVPRSILAAGWSGDGYGYEVTPPPPPPPPPPASTIITTPVPTAPSQLGSPPGDGSSWQQAPAALISAVQQASTADSNGAFTFASGSTYWTSQDPKSPQWYFVSVYSPEVPNSFAPDQFAGIEELVNGTWDIVSAVGEQAPGCYGPGHEQPNGPFAVPANILSDFAQTC